MTIKEFLKNMGIDINDNQSFKGNHVKGELALMKIHIDFSKDLQDINDEDKYQLGRILVLNGTFCKAYFQDQIIEGMNKIIADNCQPLN